MNRLPPTGPASRPQKRQLQAQIHRINKSLEEGDGAVRLESADGQSGFPTITRAIKANPPVSRANPPQQAMQRLGEGDLQNLADRFHAAQNPIAVEPQVVQPSSLAVNTHGPVFTRQAEPLPMPPKQQLRTPARAPQALNQQKRGTKQQPNPPAVTAQSQAALGVQVISNKPNDVDNQQPVDFRPQVVTRPPQPLREPPIMRRQPLMPNRTTQIPTVNKHIPEQTYMEEPINEETQVSDLPFNQQQAHPANIQHMLDQRMQYLKTNQTEQQTQPAPAKRQFQRVDEVVLSQAEQQPFRVQQPLDNDADFAERIIFPSHGVLYDIQDIGIRPIDVPDLAMLAKAMRDRDLIAINDVIDSCIDVDVRDLWVGDWRYILYWLRINSLTKIPYTVNWTSFYGNRNRSQVTNTNIDFTLLSDLMDRQTWEIWESRGFTYPTVRDMEEYTTNQSSLSENYKWLYDRAQFLQGNSIEEKVLFLQSPEMNSLNTLADIKEFSGILANAGVKESIQVKDANFDLHKAFALLKQEEEQLSLMLETDINLAIEQEEATIERLQLVKAELQRFNQGEAEPMLETIPMRISVYAFFPGI